MPPLAIDRKSVLKIARACIGTPYHHQGRLIGIGLDSIGLVIVVGRTLGLQYALNTRYKRRPHGFGIQEAMDGLMDRRDGVLPGSVGMFSDDKIERPSHLAIYTEKDGIIHSVPRYGVIELHVIPESLKCFQVYDYPGVE